MEDKKIPEIWLVVNQDGDPLHYGLNGGGQVGYCLYRGEIAAFGCRAEAELVISESDKPELWRPVRFSANEEAGRGQTEKGRR